MVTNLKPNWANLNYRRFFARMLSYRRSKLEVVRNVKSQFWRLRCHGRLCSSTIRPSRAIETRIGATQADVLRPHNCEARIRAKSVCFTSISTQRKTCSNWQCLGTKRSSWKIMLTLWNRWSLLISRRGSQCRRRWWQRIRRNSDCSKQVWWPFRSRVYPHRSEPTSSAIVMTQRALAQHLTRCGKCPTILSTITRMRLLMWKLTSSKILLPLCQTQLIQILVLWYAIIWTIGASERMTSLPIVGVQRWLVARACSPQTRAYL